MVLFTHIGRLLCPENNEEKHVAIVGSLHQLGHHELSVML